ncbi:MAG: NAD(P)/FAD-dependent oxidoreductase [Lachnospiraceae bacterium]|nr:NAD(P)/FAD-dependent oxidoreductase [Lachnospiraceae bacterium]
MADIVIVGGGAAGMMAAIAAAGAGGNVTLIEKNEKLGKKLFITGKGRCNVTNACDVEDLFGNVLEHSKFLYSAIYGFDNQSVMNFFEENGCKLKIERGQRVFPVSDHSSDIIKVLEKKLKESHVSIRLNSEIKKITVQKLESPVENSKKKQKQTSKVCSIEVYDKQQRKNQTINAASVIVATGGMSYVLTGSTGDGYKFAKELGHTVTPLSPALVPFAIKESWCHALQGLSLKNVKASVMLDGKEIYSDFGEFLFTHYGVSGPLMLSAASVYAHYVHAHKRKDKAENEAKIYIDLKPALTYEQLDKRVLREFDANKNKQFKNVLGALFPAKLVPIMPQLSAIAADKKINEITKEEREHFVSVIKRMELTVSGLRGYDEAIVTKGGVAVNEVDPSTMESKLVKGLYFAGEVLDIDALTGGFNLQIAWSTGYLAGISAAQIE